MGMVNLKGVSIAFGDVPLLEKIDLVVEPGERVCLVGRNGCGKTTLLRIISGELPPDEGDVESSSTMRVALLPQEVPDDLKGVCAQVVAGGLQGGGEDDGEGSHKVARVLSRLGLDETALTQEMSGGLKRRVLLARALVGEPDLLLLDEPTNHLDIDSINWLEKFFEKYDGTLVFITHDRAFLRGLATRIVEIELGDLTSYPGNYDRYLERRVADQVAQERQRERLDKKLAAEEVWVRKGIVARRTRNEGRVRALKRLREEAGKRRVSSGSVKMSILEGGRASKKIVVAKNVSFAYPGGELLVEGLDATIYRGDKVAVIGRNGCGKTTLLRLLLGKLTPTVGEVRVGDNLEVAYLDQLRDALDEEKTVVENVIEAGDKIVIGGRSTHIYTYLKEFLFSPERARTPVWVLSGGEKNRLLLAKLFTKPANVLVLDEPTNDLDTETLELLEDRVVQFGGTVLLVSHDREFINNTAAGTLVFESDGSIAEYVGGYDDWISQRIEVEEPASKAPEKKKARPKKQSKQKLTFKEKFALEALPGQIDDMEKEQLELHDKLADPDLYKNAGHEVSKINGRLTQLESSLAEAYDRWTELEEIRESSQ